MPTPPGAGSRPFAFVVYLTVAALSGLVAFTATAGIVDSMPLAWAVAIVAAGLAGWRCATHADLAARLAPVPRAFRLAFIAGAVAVLIQLGVLATFIIDPNVAVWTDDIALSTKINRQVAHYTGQAELAEAIQAGIEARKSGDDRTATIKFGRAAQLAHASGNKATEELLATVVDIEDAATGTVRLRRKVEAADEMALDTRSTKTVRVGRAQ